MSRRHAAPLETLSVEGLPEGAVPAFEAALQTVCATVGLFRDEATDTWRVEGVREAIEARGASLLYLPPYSPDLNPIELAFSKLKRLLRAAAARTADALEAAISAALGHFTPAECANYLRHCGYAQSGR